MGRVSIKFLTLFVAIVWAKMSFAQILTQEEFKTHLRWNLYIPKDQVSIKKSVGELEIRTLNIDLFEKVKLDLQKAKNQPKYFSEVHVNNSDEKGVASIRIKLSNPEVELFSFYRERDQRYVMDFWIDADAVNSQKAAIAKSPIVVTPANSAPKQVLPKKLPEVVKKAVPTKVVEKKVVQREDKDYRDFRYGAPFIWDNEPFSPSLATVINLSRKTPEYFYPVQNRNFAESEREAHLQLCINLYRQKKWGLMYKSIKLFQEKYGQFEDEDLIEYLKANAIIRNGFEKGESSPEKMAISIYKNISERTKNYELKKAILKYLINYAIMKKELIKSLQESKKLYVISKENFDIEESRYAAEAILYNFSKLNQIEKIREFLADKTIQKLLPSQVSLAYEIYSLLKIGREEQVISLYKTNKNSLAKPVDQTILFNVAEALFREGKFEESIKLFDEFLADYSHVGNSGYARVRIALAYEILGKDEKVTTELYKNAINRSVDELVRYEAKVRYVAMRNLRKMTPDAEDKEARVFLDTKEKNLSRDLKKILWLTRLRLFITDQEYTKALTYLNAIPINTMKPSELRVFESDGAEIVYGLIDENFRASNFSHVIKLWELYKERYIDKVASDPYLQYVVAQSYVKLELFEGFEGVFSEFAKIKNNPAKTYPEWIRRDGQDTGERLVSLLDIIRDMKLKNWETAERKVDVLIEKDKEFNKSYYYKGIINYNKKDYKAAAYNLEKYLASVQTRSIFDPNEVAEMIKCYTEALYELGEREKYAKVAKAIIKDTQNYSPENLYMKKLRERLAYITIEILSSEKKDSSQLLLEPEIKEFLKEYKESIYEGRVKYLLALSFVNRGSNEEAQKIFDELLGNEKVSEYIKELVRSEISLLKIKERSI